MSLVGPPPRTMQAIEAQAPEDPNEALVGSAQGGHGVIVNALSQQPPALTSLVAHLMAQSNDPLLDLQSGISGSSSIKGVQRRENLQAELAARSGNFSLLMMQQVHKRLHPGRALPRSEEELGQVSFLEYLEKCGGYKQQKTLGLVQLILAHAVDAAAQGDSQGAKEILALLAMAVEQASHDNGDWCVAYLINLMEDPPIQLYRGRPFSPLIPPSWTATTLSYIKDMEALAAKKPDAKTKGQKAKEDAEGTDAKEKSPKRKPRFPKRPKALQDGSPG